MIRQLLFACLCVSLLLSPAVATSDYKVIQAHKNSTSVTLNLEYTGKDQYYLKPTSPISKHLTFTFKMLTYNDFTFKIADTDKQRFEVPTHGIYPTDPVANFSFPISLSGIEFEYSENPFDFRITRKYNRATLFSTYHQKLIFSDHYLEIGTEIASDFVYGIGERFQESFRKKDGKWTVFNRDRGQVIDRGDGLQTYGHYPFYFLRETQAYNLFHISYLRNSNAMDVIKSRDSSRIYITYKVIGGVFDFRFFLGEETPEATVIKLNFHSGRSDIPPFWALGFHQCRWGYKDANALLNVLSNYEKNGLPLDTIWSDIDYMLDYEDFTIDESRFPLNVMKNITDRYKYIPIIDAGIKTSGSAYEQGLRRGVFVMDGTGKKPYVGRVWPGSTTFVDFFHPNATQYWQDMLNVLYQKVQFNGVWLDMNELANFCDGACQPSQDPVIFDYSKDLPYNPGNDNIESHTISLNSTHYGNLSEANVHAYSAFHETYATNLFLRSKNLKPFIITRSSTFGSNKYGFHWTGDNYASWQYLKGSIADNFVNQMFGFQMVGPDICGFGGDTTEELCARWYQLGALYTFARSHNADNSKSQEPYALGDTVLAAAKTNLKLRYSLLKHFYFLFVSNRGLGTIWRPLFFEFSFDSTCYNDDVADTQFLIGPNLMATPILEPGTTSRKVYFPPYALWYDFYTGKQYGPGTYTISNVKLTDPVPLFLLEGSMIFTQNTEKVVNTKQLDNVFIVNMGLDFNEYISNSTHDIYEAEGVVLAVKNYNNDSHIELCYRQGCDYIFNAVATISTHSHLELDIVYLGGIRLNEQIFVSDFNLYFGEFNSHIKMEQPLEVTGLLRVKIPIPDAKKKTMIVQ